LERQPFAAADVLELAQAWSVAVGCELGLSCMPDVLHGIDVRPIGDGRYLAKLGLEIASIETKTGRGGSRTPWEIAHDAAAGDPSSRALWRKYGAAMMGARQLFWSRGARDFFGLGEDVEDEALAADGGVGIVLGEWEGKDWDDAARALPFWLSLVASAAASATPISSLLALPGAKSGRLAPGIVVFPNPGIGSGPQ
jgi:hypothetical protein